MPAVVDLASMRDAMNKLGSDPSIINPLVNEKCPILLQNVMNFY